MLMSSFVGRETWEKVVELVKGLKLMSESLSEVING